MEKVNEFIEYADSLSDKRTADWLLVQSPVPVLVLTLIYIVYVKWIGPKMMESRQPYSLRYPLVFYNAALSLLNLYIFEELIFGAIAAGYSFPCQPLVLLDDPKHIRVASAVWWYYFSKILEFNDTVFFVLRKKYAQISFLHVYHHATMPFLWWIGVKWVAGGQSVSMSLRPDFSMYHYDATKVCATVPSSRPAAYAASINAFIHVIMYFYYGLSALGPAYQKYLWWKRYLTQLQLLQFCVALAHSIHSWYVQCPFPNWMYWALILYTISFLFLFGNFYLQAYIKKKRLYTKEKLQHYEMKKNEPGQNGHMANGVDKKRD